LIGLGILAVCFVAVVFYVPMMFFSKEIIALWVSSDFAENAAPLASVMAIASLVYLFGNVFENAVVAMGQARQVLKVYVVGVLFYFVAITILKNQVGVISFMYAYLVLCCTLALGFFVVYNSSRLKLGAVSV
jgi:O-antigen/teichoic acid export membrane protein